MMHNLV